MSQDLDKRRCDSCGKYDYKDDMHKSDGEWYCQECQEEIDRDQQIEWAIDEAKLERG